jgi:hypothetical protein
MSIVSSTVSVTATRIPIPVPPAYDFAAGAFLEMTNADPANSVRIGGDNIEYADGGTLLVPGATWFSQGEFRPGDTVYAICDTALTATLHILWSRV